MPLRDGLWTDAQQPCKSAYAAKVFEDFIKAMLHRYSVNALTVFRQRIDENVAKTCKVALFADLRLFGKLPYMAANKQDLDPRAVLRGQAIRAARKARRLSQQYVADYIGSANRVSVSNWEKGKVADIDRKSVLGLCKLFGFEERELYLEDDSETEFEVALSREAKSFAYRWDEFPEWFRERLRKQVSDLEHGANKDVRKKNSKIAAKKK